MPEPTSPARRAPRLPFALACVALGLGACGGAGPGKTQGSRPRNAILISIDTLRPDFLGCYGHERPTSPTIDALAARGVRFADVSAAAPWTLPSHATLLTGLYPSHNGVKNHDNRLPDSVVTLAEEFESRGFETLAVVNTWNIAEPSFHLFQGFATDQRHFRYISESFNNPRTYQRDILGGGEKITRAARELLEERDQEKPFFLFLHTYDVHTDFNPAQRYRDQFVEPYSGPMNGRTQQLLGYRKRGQQLTEADLRWLKEMYEAEIRELDDLLRDFFAWLDEEGLAEDTLVVLVSDHGEEFQEHGGTLHGRTQYQELLQVPLLMAGPGVPAGLVVDRPVGLVDVAPTILGLFDIQPRSPLDGIDLTAAWKNPSALPGERLLFGEADHNNELDGQPVVDIKRMVRRGSDKLLLDLPSQAFELYDLGTDPHEQRDLSREHADKQQELQAALERFKQSEVQREMIAPPTEEQLDQLEAMGYAGGETVPAPKKKPEKH